MDMTTDTFFLIITIAWLSCLFVGIYIDLAVKAKVRIRKPLGCEACMGFWLGLTAAILFRNSPLECFIFATITSLMAAILQRYVNR